jgi:steroid 5-alpha reductase family enzyme
MSPNSVLVIEAIATALVFGTVWAICVRIHNYGFLDVTWTLMVGVLASADCIAGSGPVLRRLAFGAVTAAWSLRLGLFVLFRVLRHHPREDKRYATFRERWTSPAAFLAFFELQAAIAVIFSLPFLIAANASKLDLHLTEWLGLILAAVGLLGEAVSDAQAAAFKRRTPHGGILDGGLWRYSRHPNYFFELVFWIGIAVAAATLPGGWVAMICPLLIAYFLLRVTGIPLTEKYAVQTYGEAYRAYQRSTSAFVPWPVRKT